MGYSIDSRMKSSLAVTVLDHAVALRSPVATIVHSDRASQFRPVDSFGPCCTMSYTARWVVSVRAGTTPPWSHFSRFCRATCSSRRRWSTRAELRLAIVTWTERTYHRRRRQRAPGKLTPIEFELLHTSRNCGLKLTPRESTELGAVPC